ncbi:MAG: amino acid permease [Victivallaceae bacterium]
MGETRLFTFSGVRYRFHAAALLPQLNSLTDWMLFAGMIASLAGIDMTALHITDIKNPGRNYPLAILLSSIIIIAAVLGSLSIALMVPPEKLSMASGAGEAFQGVRNSPGVPWLIKPLCLMLALGAITTIFTWLLGPSKGLPEVATEGYLPELLSRRNKHEIPVNILIIQTTIISLISLAVFFMPAISGAFWVFMVLSAQMYMIMYILMFFTAFALRYRRTDLSRPYRIPGGLFGIGVVCFLGNYRSRGGFFGRIHSAAKHP